MTEEQIEDVAPEEEENEPMYYKPKSLSMIATISMWVSWVVLVVFILVIAAKIMYIMGIATQNGTTLIAMLSDPQQGEQVRIFIYDNVVLPLFTGLTYFVLLQAANLGLNALLEIDFNVREMHK
jgi:dolichol kinase